MLETGMLAAGENRKNGTVPLLKQAKQASA